MLKHLTALLVVLPLWSPAALAGCPTGADLAKGYAITWETGMTSTVTSADGIMVHTEDTYPNKDKLNRDEYRGLFILSSKSPDGATLTISFDRDVKDILPKSGEQSSEFDVVMTVVKRDGKTSVVKTRQRLELVEPMPIDIGACRYQAIVYNRKVIDGSSAAEQQMLYVPELLHSVGLHAISFTSGKRRETKQRAVSISTLP